MALKFGDPTPKERTQEDIIVCGEKVGRILINPPTQYCQVVTYHACIELQGVSSPLGLVQGHGDTREAAVADAIERGCSDAKKMLVLIEDFQRKLDTTEEDKKL